MDAIETTGVATASGPGNVRLPVRTMVGMMQFIVGSELALDTIGVRAGARAYLDVLDSLFRDQPATRQRAVVASGSVLLGAYLATRDTALLSRTMDIMGASSSRTWRTMDALRALARGDTAAAARAAETYALNGDSTEFQAEIGAMRAVAWADLLVHLGRWRDALRLYDLMDGLDRRLSHPALQIRSFAERGALYQRLGDTARAITMYDQFIDAWAEADHALQPLVERARAAAAALRGRPYPPGQR